MAECGDGDSSNGEAVQGPMTHSGPGSSMRRRYRGGHDRLRAWQQQGGVGNGGPAPYIQNAEPTTV
ncbi:unnamed protein product [Staurois parvus]|uniref:Uncharacterized protein n=1 Tax=Staurois parvus TaxID=386267 RepID=A0ABN9D9N8_9NEOB|nr:unnamed protein product [Staurois parvus]